MRRLVRTLSKPQRGGQEVLKAPGTELPRVWLHRRQDHPPLAALALKPSVGMEAHMQEAAAVGPGFWRRQTSAGGEVGSVDLERSWGELPPGAKGEQTWEPQSRRSCLLSGSKNTTSTLPSGT